MKKTTTWKYRGSFFELNVSSEVTHSTPIKYKSKKVLWYFKLIMSIDIITYQLCNQLPIPIK